MGTSILLAMRRYWPHISISQPSESITRLYFSTAFVIELSVSSHFFNIVAIDNKGRPLQTVVISYFVLRIQQPPLIRLVDTQAHNFAKSRSGTPMPDSRGTTPIAPKFPSSSSIEVETLHALSLSSKPVITQPKPVFGLPSLHGASQPHTPPARDPIPHDDEMDWTPTNPASATTFGKQQTVAFDNDDNWLRPQRFFAPEKPTGLEGLFESTRIQDEPMPFRGAGRADTEEKPYSRWLDHLRKWGWIYTLFVGVSIVCLPYILKWIGLMGQGV